MGRGIFHRLTGFRRTCRWQTSGQFAAACMSAILACLSMSAGENRVTAGQTGGRVCYVDSIRNDGIVYSEHEALSLITYLRHIKEYAPEDSLRLYATEALLNYSWYLIGQDEWFLCGRLLDKARSYCPPGNQNLIHNISAAQGGIMLFNGDNANAGKIFLDVNKFHEQNKDTTEWLKSCVNLGLYYSKNHNKPKALEYYGKVLDVARSHKKYENYFSIVTGYAESVEEDSIVDLPTLEKALRISQENGYTFLLASNYNDLARFYYRMDNFHEAMANARNAARYADRFGQNDLRISALGIMADIHYSRKNYVAAYDMEAERFKASQKRHDRQAVRIYDHLNYADSLIGWIEANVTPCTTGRHTPLPVSRDPGHALWIILMIIASAAAVAFFAARHRMKRHRDEMCGQLSADAADDCHQDEGCLIFPEGSRKEIAALNMIATHFNPTLDRIRNELKDLPKTGNQEIDTKIRNIANHLLQSRLPERGTPLSKAINDEEENLKTRLCSAYPGLTRNDLRMALYIRAGLNAQEICALTGLQTKSINQARYRLRKSLGLGQNDSLEEHLMSF